MSDTVLLECSALPVFSLWRVARERSPGSLLLPLKCVLQGLSLPRGSAAGTSLLSSTTPALSFPLSQGRACDGVTGPNPKPRIVCPAVPSQGSAPSGPRMHAIEVRRRKCRSQQFRSLLSAKKADWHSRRVMVREF